MRTIFWVYVLAAFVLLILFVMNLFCGAVDIPFLDVYAIIVGSESKTSWRYIILESRLPQAITAVFSGAALAASGLLLQTTFRNPLAGPSIFGVTGGAGIGVAIVMLTFGGYVDVAGFSFFGNLSVLIAAFLGAMLVLAIIFLFSKIIKNTVFLLIIGIMIGYLSSSLISLLNYLSTAEGVKSYMLWGMGTFSGVSSSQLPLFVTLISIGLIVSVFLSKALNTLSLGEKYAESLGVNTISLRNKMLVITGVLTAITTAFCGPISFIGLAVPHLARLFLVTDDHRSLLPVSMIFGGAIALACNLLSLSSMGGESLPINSITPLIGAPIIIYVILTKKGIK